MKIPEKKVIGIVGPSGSGKSTLLDILLGVLEPDKGVISVGSVIIDSNNIRCLQDRIGYVSQNIFLKDGSILENIAFGLSSECIDLSKVKKSIKLAQLEVWIEGLKEGLLTNVGENGVQVSGGQKQRIGIARALYNDPDILLFDEATSALDSVTESLIIESVLKLNNEKTIVMIAHRLNTVKECDLIYLVDGGEIIATGTYDWLFENNSVFRKMIGEKMEWELEI